MKQPLFERIKDVFISQSLKIYKEPKISSGRIFNSCLFISCDYKSPFQLRKYFQTPHPTVYSASRITLTDLAFEKVCDNVWTLEVGDTQTASINVEYLGDDSVQIIACGAFSGYAVLWCGRLQDLVRYFNDHHEPCSTHETYK